MENRKCKVCGEVKPITEYYKHGKYYDTKCKECAKAYSRKYASEHAEELKAYRSNTIKIIAVGCYMVLQGMSLDA